MNSVLFCLFTFCLINYILCRVGFEIELGQVQISRVANSSAVIPRKAVLYSSPSLLWNLTVDILKNGKNDLEVVTVPFDIDSDSHFARHSLKKAATEIVHFLSEVSLQIKESNNSESKITNTTNAATSIVLPNFVSPEVYTIEFHPHPNTPRKLAISPQVTFGLRPTHFYHLVCTPFDYRAMMQMEMEWDFEVGELWDGVFISSKFRNFQESICTNLQKLFNSKEFLPLNKDPAVLSFVALMYQYLIPKTSLSCLHYPKLLAGTFLSRVSFVDLFHSLEEEAQKLLRENLLLYKVSKFAREFHCLEPSFQSGQTSKFQKENVFPTGFLSGGSTIITGPTIEEWIEGFTREKDPIDLLVALDIDKSMGSLNLDYCYPPNTLNSQKLQSKRIPLWIIENRGLNSFKYHDIPSVFESLLLFLSEINTKPVPILT